MNHLKSGILHHRRKGIESCLTWPHRARPRVSSPLISDQRLKSATWPMPSRPSCRARIARRARWAEAGPPPAVVRHAPCSSSTPTPGLQEVVPAWSATSSASIHPHGDQADLRRPGAPGPGLRPALSPWSTDRATSATSTAITPRRCSYTEARSDGEVARGPAATASTKRRGRLPPETYDGEDSEEPDRPAGVPFPTCWPTAPPGIAVGMATAIPPHNAGEICAAALAPDQDAARPPWTS